MKYKFKLSHIVPAFLFIVDVIYGGSKPPATTNTPPDDISSPTNAPTMLGLGLRPRSTMEDNILCTPTPSTYTSVTAWNKRGAYCDWVHITFPDTFAFPSGTNLLTGVTVMAYGELRENLRSTPTPSLYTLPSPVSLEPDASSFAYGLTPSNTFLFSWQNVCVDRSPTNRVDASIELFASGVCSVRFGASQTDYPPTPPPGFVGEGQDTNWLAATFSPADFDATTNKGYEAWLDENYVGVNEQNGHYRADITVASLPDCGAPCYLVCGPYKVVVSHPGTYSFPLEVFKSYRARTYPIALPLSISTDDGYRGDLPPALLSYACCSPAPTTNAQLPTPTQPSVSPVLTASRPRLALSAPHPSDPPEYEICEQPRLVISPTEIPLDQAVGTHISIWCNVASTARRYCALISREFRLNFCNPSDAEIVAAEVEDLVEIMIDAPLGTCAGTITITDLHSCCECGSCTGPGCSCDCSCWRHSSYDSSPTNSPSATP